MSRHLTHRFWFCLIIGWGGLALSLLFNSPNPAALAAPFLGALVFSVIDGWWPEVQILEPVVSSPRVVEGDSLEFSVSFETEKNTWVEAEIQFPASLAPQTPTRLVTMLNGKREFSVKVKATRWGSDGPEWVLVAVRDRLGFTERLIGQPLHLPVRVHPPAEQLKSLIPLYRERSVTGEHRARSKGSGSELAEVRPYRWGDPVRMIHPRLSARRGTPMVVERHLDRSSDIVLMIDSAQDLGVDLSTTLRWTVTAAMALGERHLRAQDRVGLLDLGHGVRWVPPRLGRRHLHTIVDSLLATEVLPRNEAQPSRLDPSKLPRSATIVTISPLLSEGVLSALADLRQRGHEILVIQPNVPPPDAAVREVAQRVFRAGNEINLRWLQSRGVVIIPWLNGDSLEHVMSRVIRNLGRVRQAVLSK